MPQLDVLEEKQRLKSLKEMLHQYSAPAADALIERKGNGDVQCFACGHRCLVKPGRDGVCRVRFNDEGTLLVPHGYVGALACDPIEKKPFFHVLPGSDALTFGMLGCDFHCGYCQNWVTSQMLRDADAVASPKMTTPRQLVDLAIKHGAPVVASSYNEPLITSEWAVDVFKEARQRGLRCAYISNGNGTPQVLDFIRPHVDAYKVDLKTFNPKNYRQLGGVLENVTDTIRMLKERGFWVEIVTLVVPGFSDDPDDLKRMADFLSSVDPLMPWHMTAFHPDYKMTEGYRSTTVDDLLRIVEYGKQAGIRYMYPGNLPGQVGEWENTRCHHCAATVIERWGFLVTNNRVKPDGLCPDCRKPLPGIWGKASGHGDGRVRPLLQRAVTRRGRLPLILVIVVPVLALWPVVTAEFIPLDDSANVSRNPDYNPPALANLGHYWTGPFLNMYAPLTYTAWAGVARVAWMDSADHGGLQLNPYVFHAANLMLHLVCAALVFAILRKLGLQPWAACAGALLFALHPMQVEPVAWVTGFRDLLAAMFSLASLLAYITFATRSDRKRVIPFVLACAFLLAALLSKPTSVVVPLLAAAIDLGVLRRPLREVMKPVGVMLLLVVPFAILTKLFQSADVTYTPPLWSRPIIAADALGFYAAKVVFPLRVGLDYGRSPRWLLDQKGMGLLWLALVPVGVVLWRFRRHVWVIAGVAILVASLLPVLGLTKFDFQHHSTVADRYVYLGMLGPALLLAMATREGGRNTAIVCGVLLLLLAARSHAQSRAWENGESIFRATRATNPHSLIANRGLALIAMSDGRRADAEALLNTTLRFHPDDPVTHFHLGNLYLATGRAKEAVPHLRIAAATHAQPWVAANFANALARSGDTEEARRVLESALAKSPNSAELHASLAAVHFRRGDRAAAIEHYRDALRINPDLTVAAQELAALEQTPATTSASAPSTAPVPGTVPATTPAP